MWLIIAFGFMVVLYYVFIKRGFDYWEKRGVPTAKDRHWFFGHYKEVFLTKKHLAHLQFELYRYGLFQSSDDIFRESPEAPVLGYYILNTPALVVRHPELIRTILTSEFSSFSCNGIHTDKKYDCVAGWNPFFLKDEEWKMSRGHATPALSIAKLKGYLPIMFRVAGEMVKYGKKHCKGSVRNVDLKDISTMFTTDVMANAICGVANNTFEDRHSLFATITEQVSRMLVTSVRNNIKSFAVAALPALNIIFQKGFLPKKLESLLVSLTRKIIKDRTISGETRNDVFQVMMAFRANDDQGVFTDEYITSHVFTILLDLYETSSNVILATLFALAWHSEYQDKLRSEISALQSETKGEYSVEDIEKFKYLDMVVCESMRLYSPVSILSRECTNDCLLTVPGQKPVQVPKGTPVTVPVACIHVDPKYYPEPNKFDPGRFSDEEVAKRPKFTFTPFGEGPKKCLGMRIASLQIKVAVMSIIKHFKLKPCSKTSYPLDIDPKIFIVTRPTHGACVYFEEVIN